MKTIVMDTSNAYLVIGLYEDDQCIDKCSMHIFVTEHLDIILIPWLIPAFGRCSQPSDLLKTVYNVSEKRIVQIHDHEQECR